MVNITTGMTSSHCDSCLHTGDGLAAFENVTNSILFMYSVYVFCLCILAKRTTQVDSTSPVPALSKLHVGQPEEFATIFRLKIKLQPDFSLSFHYFDQVAGLV